MRKMLIFFVRFIRTLSSLLVGLWRALDKRKWAHDLMWLSLARTRKALEVWKDMNRILWNGNKWSYDLWLRNSCVTWSVWMSFFQYFEAKWKCWRVFQMYGRLFGSIRWWSWKFDSLYTTCLFDVIFLFLPGVSLLTFCSGRVPKLKAAWWSRLHFSGW